MRANIVTLGELADRLGRDRSNTRKLLLKLAPALGIEIIKSRVGQAHGQATLTLDGTSADRFVEAVRAGGYLIRDGAEDAMVTRQVNSWGNFYVILLAPDLSKGRVKLGYAANVAQRLAEHRTASPTAELVRSWPCKPTWENAAIASIARIGCNPLSLEVYDCDDLDALLGRAEAFFGLMPR